MRHHKRKNRGYLTDAHSRPKITPRRKLDEALWRDLELNGGTDSLLFRGGVRNAKLRAAIEMQ